METLPSPSTAAQVLVTIIPITGIVMGSVLMFFFLLYNHKQRMLMIEKGQSVKGTFDLDTYSLFAGIILLVIGLCLTIFFSIKEGSSYITLGGIIPLSFGFSLMLFFIIHQKLIKSKNE